MAALLVCTLYHITQGQVWHLVYVDDFLSILPAETYPEYVTLITLWLIALGAPLSWKKTFVGQINTWLGFAINTIKGTLQVSADKIRPFPDILEAITTVTPQTAHTLEKWAGTLNWATIASMVLRPYLYHIYTWLMVAKQHGRCLPSTSTKKLAALMIKVLNMPPPKHTAYYRRQTVVGATDAAGYDEKSDRKGCIGGWWTPGTAEDKSEVLWFSIDIDRTETWAYKERSSQRRIAALELMGTLVLLKLMQQEGHLARVHLTTPVATDNKGNAYGLGSGRFKKWPQADIVLELAVTCHMAQINIGACHVKRASNTWADDLADGKTDGFDPSLRRHFDLEDDGNWIIWQTLKQTAPT